MGAMSTQEMTNYERIAEAIDYIHTHFREQPDLEEVARQVHLSPYHFQRLFTEWAGVSPKKFLQYLTVDYAKTLLKQPGRNLLDTAFETGLSGTGRLHDLFIRIEGMTPGEYRQGGAALSIQYAFYPTTFGKMLVASTSRGICHMAFVESEEDALEKLQAEFPQAAMQLGMDAMQQKAMAFFRHDWHQPEQVKLHLRGSAFQLKVWETLLKIPAGSLASYADVAQAIDRPGAARAVGTAIGQNPVAFLIPCHRVIQNSGSFGQYHWGSTRKTAIIGWEAAHFGQTA